MGQSCPTATLGENMTTTTKQCDHEYEYDEQQSEPWKGNEYFFCRKCESSWYYDHETDSLKSLESPNE